MTDPGALQSLRDLIGCADDPEERDQLIIASDRIARFVASEDAIERVALAIQKADNCQAMEGSADGLSEDVSDWGAFIARAVLNLIASAGMGG